MYNIIYFAYISQICLNKFQIEHNTSQEIPNFAPQIKHAYAKRRDIASVAYYQ